MAKSGQVRVSPGVYRPTSGGKGISTPPPKAKGKGKKGKGKGPKEQSLGGLTPEQNQAINLRQDADIGLSQFGNQMMPGIIDSYSQPFNWEGLPSAPVTGDYNAWVDEQMGNYNKAFDDRMNKVFDRDMESFEQRMANTGNPPGSPRYNMELEQLRQSQNDARTQAYAQNQGQAVQSAQSLFGIGSQARGNALNEGMMQRNMPLNEFNAIYGATSGMAGQNLGYSQALGLQNDEQAFNKWMMQNTPRGGGGGGGGGGAGPLWQQYGFKSPMEYDAYKTQQARDNAMWDYQNNPQYRQPRGPSAGSQFGGQVLGTGLGILGMYAGNSMF